MRARNTSTDPAEKRPEALGEILGRLFTARGWGREQGLRQLEDAWRQAVGERWAVKTRIVNLQRGVLEVLVQNPALLQELAGFEKARLLRSLQQQLGAERIRDIRFRLGVS